MKIRRILVRSAGLLVAVWLAVWFYHIIRGGVDVVTRDAMAPYGRFAGAIRDVSAGIAQVAGGHARLLREHAALSTEVADLRARLLFLGELRHENARLREALALQSESDELVCAEVVSRGGASGWWKTIRIDKGMRDGVFRNGPVVNADGLVGRVVATSSETADVLLLSDVNSKLSCVIEGAGPGARGILSGSGVSGRDDVLELLHVVEPMSLAYLKKDLNIGAGARVVTSGLGGLYPAGLPVGEVVDVRMDSTSLFQRARVAPYVDFASLDRVFVRVARRPTDSGEGVR